MSEKNEKNIKKNKERQDVSEEKLTLKKQDTQ